MTVEAVVTPRPGLIPDGTEVQAFTKVSSEVERREDRTPIPAPVATGVLSGGKVTLKGLTALTDYVLEAVVDEIQKVVVKAKKGTFKLTFEGKQTPAIKYNATAKELEEALVALENVAAGDVEVSGGPGDETGSKPYLVVFRAAWAGKNVAAMTADATGLEEGEKKVEISTSTQGSKSGAGGIQRSVLFRTGE